MHAWTKNKNDSSSFNISFLGTFQVLEINPSFPAKESYYIGRWPSWAHSDGFLAYVLGKYEFDLNIC